MKRRPGVLAVKEPGFGQGLGAIGLEDQVAELPLLAGQGLLLLPAGEASGNV